MVLRLLTHLISTLALQAMEKVPDLLRNSERPAQNSDLFYKLPTIACVYVGRPIELFQFFYSSACLPSDYTQLNYFAEMLNLREKNDFIHHQQIFTQEDQKCLGFIRCHL